MTLASEDAKCHLRGVSTTDEPRRGAPAQADDDLLEREWDRHAESYDTIYAHSEGRRLAAELAFLDHAVSEGFLSAHDRALIQVGTEPAALVDRLLTKPPPPAGDAGCGHHS